MLYLVDFAGDEDIIRGSITNDFERLTLLTEPLIPCLSGARDESKRATCSFKLFDEASTSLFFILVIFFMTLLGLFLSGSAYFGCAAIEGTFVVVVTPLF